MENDLKKASANERPVIAPLLLDINAVAAMLSISRSTIYRMSNTGLLGPMPIALGRRKFWRHEEITAWVRAGCPARVHWTKMAQEQGFGHRGGRRF